jgi:phosphotransacetylase
MSKSTKAFQKQARTAEQVAYQSADALVSGQMRTLADAFRAQADVLKKKRKKKK